MEPKEDIELAQKELKRADHSIAVSLKYTRTVDVIRGIIERLISSIEFCLEALLLTAKEEGKIEEVPKLARLKAIEAKKVYSEDKIIADFCEFFLLLRKIHNARFERAQEYRRHVTMTAYLDDGQSIQITIDIITDYYERVKEFMKLVSNYVTA